MKLSDFKSLALPPDKPAPAWSLRTILIVALVAALVPVLLLSLVQAYERLSTEKAGISAMLADRAAGSVNQTNPIIAAKRSIMAAARQPSVIEAATECSVALQIIVDASDSLISLERREFDGTVLCAGTGVSNAAANLPALPIWWPMIRPDVSYQVFGAFADNKGDQYLAIVQPIASQAGGGVLTAKVGLEWLRAKPRPQLPSQMFNTFLVGANGEPLSGSTSTDGLNFEKLNPQKPNIGETTDALGQPWIYAAEPLGVGALSLVLAKPKNFLSTKTQWRVVADVALPIMALLIASAAIWASVERFATKPIQAMRDLANDYALARFDSKPQRLAGISSELAGLKADLVNMATQSQARREHLLQSARDKEALLREVHHRVKNNIQMISSLLMLEASRAPSDQVRLSIERAQARVNAVALVHGLLNETDNQTTISSGVLMDGVVHALTGQILQQQTMTSVGWSGDRDVGLDLDVATPVVLYLIEAGRNALAHGLNNIPEDKVWINFNQAADKTITISLSDNGKGLTDPINAGSGLKLMRAYARQLGAKHEVKNLATGGTQALLSFIPRPITPQN